MAAKSCGSMSSWCIGLKAGPAAFPDRVRPGATGCVPVISGATNPFSAFAITCASSCCPAPGLAACDGFQRNASGTNPQVLWDPDPRQCVGGHGRYQGLRGPAPRSYNGDRNRWMENAERPKLLCAALAMARGLTVTPLPRVGNPRVGPSADDLRSPISIRLYVTYR